jgi:ketosteroid isomerase-like protein
MPEGTQPTRMAIAQQFLAHIGHRDLDQGIELLSPDATARVPGSHALAGTFSGRDEIIRHLINLYERTGGTFEAYKWDDWMLGELHVAALASVHLNTKGQMYKGSHLLLVRFDIHDKIDEITVFFEDQRSFERLLGP